MNLVKIMGQQDTPENSPEKSINTGAGIKNELTSQAAGALSIDQVLDEPQISPAEQRAQEVIEWAEGIYDGFEELPETNPVKAKKQGRRDAKFIDKAFEKFAEDEEKSNLIDNPDALARSLEVWSMWSEEYEGRGEEFVELVNERLYEYGRRNWREIGKETLAGLAQELAYSPLAEEGLQSVLKGYFEGPTQLLDQQHTHIQMALSAQHVLNDQKAIDKIAQIICFDTAIMPYGDDMHNTVQGDVANHAYFVQEGKNAGDLNRIREGLAGISSHGREIATSVYESSKDKLDQKHFTAFMNTYGIRDRNLASKLLDERDFLRIKGFINPANFREKLPEIEAAFKDDELAQKVVVEWYKAVALQPSLYMTEYHLTYGNRWTEANWKRKEVQELGKIEQVISIPTEDNFQFDIYLPDGDMHLIEADIESALEQYRVKIQQMKEADEEDYLCLVNAKTNPDYEGTYDVEFEISLGGRNIIACIHIQCELDSLSEHDLNKLMLSGVPDIEGEGFASAAEIWERVQNAEEERYVSKRGFKVDFISEDMLEAGLRSISFKQDPKRLQQLIAALDFKGESINYKLDRHGNLDLEGKQIYSSKLVDLIHRRTLAVLEHYMGREVLEAEGETTLGPGETGTIARPARVVFLPEGHNFSEEARMHYLLQQGKDLKVRSEERRLYNSRSRDRNSTYRQATEVDDPNLDPIEIKIDNPAII